MYEAAGHRRPAAGPRGRRARRAGCDLGPSPGFRDLRWIRPVLAGDTINFATEVVSMRASSSRPGWGIVEGRKTGVNQRGELVFSMVAIAFVPRRNSAGWTGPEEVQGTDFPLTHFELVPVNKAQGQS